MPRAGRFAAPLDGSDTEDQSGAYRRGEPWGPDAIRLFNVRQRELTPETADATGQMLWAENVRSVNHRYDEDEWEEVYVYRPFPRDPVATSTTPIAILKALDGYEYQSCEHPAWESSEAHEFCDALRRAMIAALPGYDEAVWHIDEEVGRRRLTWGAQCERAEPHETNQSKRARGVAATGLVL